MNKCAHLNNKTIWKKELLTKLSPRNLLPIMIGYLTEDLKTINEVQVNISTVITPIQLFIYC